MSRCSRRPILQLLTCKVARGVADLRMVEVKGQSVEQRRPRDGNPRWERMKLFPLFDLESWTSMSLHTNILLGTLAALKPGTHLTFIHTYLSLPTVPELVEAPRRLHPHRVFSGCSNLPLRKCPPPGTRPA